MKFIIRIQPTSKNEPFQIPVDKIKQASQHACIDRC